MSIVLTGGDVNDCTMFTRSWPGSSSVDRVWAVRRPFPNAVISRPNRLCRGRVGGRPPAFDRTIYRRRNIVERCFTRLEQFRAIATRFDKTAISYRGMIDPAMLLTWL
ncbi:hypothetical protein VA596_38370 [Amycolatopsis sp., V23-08]|uniref:Transposase n=1 Tax=Amycolatopsis heterodermiae TaxID=3110235 RepID=A0ABU5RGN9_9PSEU|nr:transposase [Amycolatopsis sp., V23-08]MEA5365443.1 hypothetical protein [Amycolatopsis sp., V23-08]